MLSIENLNAFYGKAHILHNISLLVSKGDLLAIIGRNGVGKTTLLKAIMGIDVIRVGKIIFKDRNITNLKTHEISKLGILYIPDDTGLFHGMSVIENLRLTSGKKDIDLDLIEKIYPEIRDLLNRKADLLSGGERKIVAILRSILTKTDLLLLDEPTEGIMPLIVKKIYGMLDSLRKMGKTIVIVEPGTKLNMILGVATKIAVMSEGKIIYIGESERVMEDIDNIKKYLFV